MATTFPGLLMMPIGLILLWIEWTIDLEALHRRAGGPGRASPARTGLLSMANPRRKGQASLPETTGSSPRRQKNRDRESLGETIKSGIQSNQLAWLYVKQP